MSLCRFKCVSKGWLALCSNPDIRKRSPQTLSGFFYFDHGWNKSRPGWRFLNLSRKEWTTESRKLEDGLPCRVSVMILGRRGRACDVLILEAARAERAHERDGTGQGHTGEPSAPRLLEPRRPRQRQHPRLLSRGINGYDINYVMDGGVRDGASGRAMELWADQPGVQFYTANRLSGVRGKGGKVYGRYGALYVETQGFPDAVNRPSFPSQIVRPGKVYRHDMVLKFL
uniref:Aldose 1-epimerase n=1 Tax=Aegilops tauschii TaxID=37682 RepID=N1QSC5_AEGTA